MYVLPYAICQLMCLQSDAKHNTTVIIHSPELPQTAVFNLNQIGKRPLHYLHSDLLFLVGSEGNQHVYGHCGTAEDFFDYQIQKEMFAVCVGCSHSRATDLIIYLQCECLLRVNISWLYNMNVQACILVPTMKTLGWQNTTQGSLPQQGMHGALGFLQKLLEAPWEQSSGRLVYCPH